MASSTVGTAVIKLSFDGSDVKAELSRTSSEFEKAGEKAGSQFGTALTVAMGSLISKGISKVISSITSNLDSAINRVDVINNFPKVMESLGFSADDAAVAIKSISDRLDGLPSTLNGVVGDVQKLTATMGNLNNGMVNATSLGLALNDMFLAGGKGTEAASNAMEQYNQMLAQGRPDMQSWRSILNAAPGQLKQLARTLMGATANQNDLYEALQKGNITFEQMNEAIVKLDREGGEGFDSFEKQARSATGGVGTALQNVQNRISKAIAAVIDTIGGENIASAINEFSSHFKEIGVEVGKFVKDAMSRIGDFARFVGQNMWIVDIIKGAITSIIALGIGQKIMALKTKFQALFAAISTHPFVALATAIMAIGTAISSAASRESKLTSALRSTTEASRSATEEYDRLRESRQQALQENLSEISYYEQLSNELKSITDANGKVREGYEQRARFIVDKLNSALDLEIKLNGDVVESHQEMWGAIEKTIKLKMAEIQLSSEEEAYAEAIKKRGDSMQRIVDLREQITKAVQSGSYQEVRAAIEAEKALNEEVETYKRYSWDIERYTSDYSAFVEGRYDDMTEAVWDYSDSLAQADSANKAQLEQSVSNTQSKLNEVTRLYNETGLKVYKDSMDSYQKLLTGTQEKLNSYKTVTNTSIQSVHDGFCGKLKQTVVDATTIAGGFNSVGKKGGDSLASGLSSKSGTVNNSVNNVINNARNTAWNSSSNSGWSLGNRFGGSLANGIASSGQNAINQAYALMDRLRSITGQTLPGPSIQGMKQRYNFATQSYEYVPMATGGFVDGATRALIGEAGQEVVLPLQRNTDNWSGLLANAIMEQMDNSQPSNAITVYMTNNIDNDMSIDELGRKFSQSIRRYA